MKILKSLLSVGLLGLMTACDMTSEVSPIVPPGYGKNIHEASMTILEFKQKYWTSDANSCSQIGVDENGDSIYLRGRIISSDSTGNIYKSLVLRDTTAALAFSINQSGMYKTYQYGQETVVNVTGMYVGTYRSLFQIGGDGGSETTFGDSELFETRVVPVWWAEPSLVTPLTVTLDDLKTIRSTPQGLQQWQSQLVRIDSLTFENAGQQFAPTQNESRYLRNAKGDRINLRCSQYAKFAKDVIPEGTGSIVGILSYYGTTAAYADWQVLLINKKGLIGFDTPKDPVEANDGTREKPYTITEAIRAYNANVDKKVWVKGYIVGCGNPGFVKFDAPFSANNNIYLGDAADETIEAKLLPVQLKTSSPLRPQLNLKDNPGNLGKEILIEGTFGLVNNQAGLKDPSEATMIN